MALDGFYYYEIAGDGYFERSFFYHTRRGFFADSKGRYSIEWNDLPIGERVQYEDRYGMSLGTFRVTKQVRLCGGAFVRALVETPGWEEVECRLVDLRSGSTIEVNLGGPGSRL